jgi:phosphate transport system protein
MFANKSGNNPKVTRSISRVTLEKRLQNLQTQVLTLGSLVSEAILVSTHILSNQDITRANSLILADQEINQRRIDIQRYCLRVIATQNPIASDLRFVSACLEIASELERMHDYAKGIAKVTLLIGESYFVKPPPEFVLMAREVKMMLHRALDAFIKYDIELAQNIAETDAKIDEMYQQVYTGLIKSNLQTAPLANHAHYFLWVAHNLERAGDRVTNICELIFYIVTGRRIEMNADNGLPLIENP